jgi:hypothetical protein
MPIRETSRSERPCPTFGKSFCAMRGTTDRGLPRTCTNCSWHAVFRGKGFAYFESYARIRELVRMQGLEGHLLLPGARHTRPLRPHQSMPMGNIKERPLYLNDAQIAVAVTGSDRAHEWPALVKQMEADYSPLPPIHRRMGGRFWPDVVQYLSRVNGMDEFNDAFAMRIKSAERKTKRPL